MVHVSRSAEETKKIAADFARTLQGGELVLLEGELGAGKTTFAQGLCETLGVQGPVRSPTFAILHAYDADAGSVRRVAHLDLYRFKKPEEALELGLDDWLDRPDAVVLAEWPALGGEHLSAAVTRRVAFTTPSSQEGGKGESASMRQIVIE